MQIHGVKASRTAVDYERNSPPPSAKVRPIYIAGHGFIPLRTRYEHRSIIVIKGRNVRVYARRNIVKGAFQQSSRAGPVAMLSLRPSFREQFLHSCGFLVCRLGGSATIDA
jgi:hypothetical protein